MIVPVTILIYVTLEDYMLKRRFGRRFGRSADANITSTEKEPYAISYFLTVLFERPIRKPCGMVLQDLLSTSSGMVPGKQGPENRLCGPAEWFLVSRDRRTVPVVPLVP